MTSDVIVPVSSTGLLVYNDINGLTDTTCGNILIISVCIIEFYNLALVNKESVMFLLLIPA